jgi:alanine-glyoxylate transaminase / serine-glyoxylate transaminase / serine-pyruvate transaminase
VLLTGPQKAIGAPPGVALCLFSDRALERGRSRSSVPVYYADVLRWLPIMQDPGRYYSTPCVNEIVALATALRMVHEEGLPARFARHAAIARAVRAGLEAAGLTLFTAPGCRADTLSVVLLPSEVADIAFRKEVAARGVVLAGGLGPIAGKAFRLGHMGNIGAGEVAKSLDAAAAGRRATDIGSRSIAVRGPSRSGKRVARAGPLHPSAKAGVSPSFADRIETELAGWASNRKLNRGVGCERLS